jgi:hypothetical protein
MVPLGPKSPPMKLGSTITLSLGSPIVRAIMSRCAKGALLAHTTCTAPLSSIQTIAARGSM